MDKRQFSIKLGTLVMEAIAKELSPDDIIEALEEKVREEKRIKCTRVALARMYV